MAKVLKDLKDKVTGDEDNIIETYIIGKSKNKRDNARYQETCW